MDNEKCDCCKHKNTPRPIEEKKALKNRLNRMIGQLEGISKMIDEDRYCGDIIIQISAVESALRSLGYSVLDTHIKTCVKEEIIKGNDNITDEVMELIKKLK